MANQRMFKSQILEDEFITSLDIFDRYLWIGLILVCDDQGRILDNSVLIRSKIFPLEDIPLEKISDCLKRFHKAGKIERYSTNEKPVIQIVNWWKHQNPSWAGKSQFDPPTGWMDKLRYQVSIELENGKKKTEIKRVNWGKSGGYVGDLPSDLPSDRNRNRNRNRDRKGIGIKDKGLIKGKGEEEEQEQESNAEAETKDPISPSPSSSSINSNGLPLYQQLFNEIEKLANQHLTQEEIIEVTKQIIGLPAKIEHVHSAINDLKDNNKKITKNSLLGFIKGAWQYDYQMGRES